MRLLIIEDEQRVADFLVRGLHAEGHSCEVAADGDIGLQFALNGDFDVVILDRLLPGRDGMAVLQALKAQRPESRVLLLTALDAVEERVAGLRGGADDYLGKPFDFEELLARVEALGRRGSGDRGTAFLSAGGVVLDTAARSVTVNGIPVELTRLEFDLLRLFLKELGRALSRERILSRVWSSSEDPMTNVVDVYVRRLRSKIDQGQEDRSLIETLRGIGYRFRAD